METWNEVSGYKGIYEVSDQGRILNVITGYIAKIKYKNYQRIILKNEYGKTNYSVHRLVALAFIPNPENKPCINHKNGIKYDNRAINLEWCTYSENRNHAIKYLDAKMKRILSAIQVSSIRILLKRNISVGDIAQQFNCSSGTIRKIRSNKYY